MHSFQFLATKLLFMVKRAKMFVNCLFRFFFKDFLFNGISVLLSTVTLNLFTFFIFSVIFNYRCTPPSKKNDYQKIYSHWCNEFEKYKSAMKQWQAKQEVSTHSINFMPIYSFSVRPRGRWKRERERERGIKVSC